MTRYAEIPAEQVRFSPGGSVILFREFSEEPDAASMQRAVFHIYAEMNQKGLSEYLLLTPSLESRFERDVAPRGVDAPISVTPTRRAR